MRSVALLLVTVTICACANLSDSPLVTETDELSGTTHIKLKRPHRFATARPSLATTGKDFVYLAPVSVSRHGTLRRFLWLAIATTIDHTLTGNRPASTEEIVLVLDGEPMSLDMKPWADVSPFNPYDTGMFVTSQYAIRASQSQLQRIANASDIAVLHADSVGRSTLYSMIDPAPSHWRDFQ